MTEHIHEPAKSHNFSLAFEQMCSIVAISKTKTPHETLNELVLQCFAVLPEDKFHNEQQLAETISTLFGLQIPEHEIQFCLDELLSKGDINQHPEQGFTLPLELRASLQTRINKALALEDRVKQNWLEETLARFPTLPVDHMWDSLRAYLAKAFRRHGLQTAALLDPSIETPAEYSDSLSALLRDSLRGFPPEQQAPALEAISRFLATVGENVDRATYITQLADGVFNYYSLTVAPDIAERFREQLSPLTLFLDTNFLFGILDLHVHPQVAVSNDLLQVIKKYGFPFKLRYHQRTERELTSSIDHHAQALRTRKWRRSLSRAAATSRYLSGIEQRYHQRHAETGIDVESFLQPYEHVDILLKQKNIDIYYSNQDRLRERVNLLHEYNDYLKLRGKEKPYQLIDHDTTVVDVVRQLRSSARSSLEAGALFITCDYTLYKFDWEASRKDGVMACTVLPNLLWQVLRPFVPSDLDFDRSFAETFAIPEFRIIGSGASKAASKMLYILEGLKDFPEDTATRLLSNDLLIAQLRHAENDQQFQEYVEAAIVTENVALQEEKAALAQQAELERAARETAEKLLKQEQLEREKEKAEAAQTHEQITELFEIERRDLEKQKTQAVKDVVAEKQAKAEAEKRVMAEIQARQQAEKLQKRYAALAGLMLSLFIIAGFELLVYLLPWPWLVSHPNSYGLQGAFGLTVIVVVLGIFRSDWRKWCFTVGAITFLGIGVQLLGGPSTP